jgi:Tfp pilus assembly PilM family ATPase
MRAGVQTGLTDVRRASRASGWKALWPRRSAIMFDLGAAGIRACQLQGAHGRVRVCDALRVELPAQGQDGAEVAPGSTAPHVPAAGAGAKTGSTGAASRSPAADDDNMLGERLSRLIGQGGFSGRNVGVVLSSSQVQFHALRVPEAALHQPREALHQALRWEVARETRTEPQELEVRHWSLPCGHNQAPNVVAVALPVQRASAWVSRLRPYGLRLSRLDVAPCAHVRLASQLWPPATHDLWCVLDLGRRHGTLTVALGGVPAYIRPIQASTEHWTRTVSHALDVPPPVADHLLRTCGIEPGARSTRCVPEPSPAGSSGDPPVAARPGSSGSLPEADEIPGVLFGVLSETLTLLIRDLERCLAYALQSFPESSVTRVVLAGGGANLSGLASFIETVLSLPCSVLSCEAGGCGAGGIPFEPESAAAVGGALLDLEQA